MRILVNKNAAKKLAYGDCCELGNFKAAFIITCAVTFPKLKWQVMGTRLRASVKNKDKTPKIAAK